MDGISSTPVENSVQFLRLRDQYKSKLLGARKSPDGHLDDTKARRIN